jgi:predicted PurR-regulated permease PerM
MRKSKNLRQAEPAGTVPAPVALAPVLPVLRQNAFMFGVLGGLGVLVALLIGTVIGQLSTVLIYVGVALFVALGLDPLVSWLEKRIPRWAAVLTVFGAIIILVGLLLMTIIPIIVEQIANAIDTFPGFLNTFLASDFLRNFEAQLAGVVDLQQVNAGIQNFIKDPNNFINIGGGLLVVGAGIAGGITGVIIVLILTLYFLSSLPTIKKATYRFVPASKRVGFMDISDQITSAVGRYIVGQFSLALINGVLSFIFLSIIGAPKTALLAFIAFLFSLVPLVGTLFASILISLLCLFASPLTALVAIIYYLIYMQIEAYVLSPRIMNKAVNVPGAVVVIAAIAGGTLGGVLGALVAIPIAASGIIIIEKVLFPQQDLK